MTVLDPHPFSIERLSNDVFKMLDASVGEKPLILQIDLDPALPPGVFGDEMRLRQVLINLCGNAIKFTAAGEVRLGVGVIGRDSAGTTIEFSVSDSGIGIAPENHARIFNGFSQAEGSTTRRFGGSGLGLSISQQLVGLMGGQIALESALGQGSRFAFSLRFAEVLLTPDSPVQPASGRDSARLAGLRVLVVEDNRINRQIAQELLETEGAEIEVAANGLLGVHAVLHAIRPFDAVLMDLQMPEMDGYLATAEIRRHAAHATLPIIAMTANAMASDRGACLAAGMDDHVGKPFDFDALVATLRFHTRRTPSPTSRESDVARRWPADLLAAAKDRGIALDAALARLGGRGDSYLRLVRSFLDDLATLPQKAASLIGQGQRTDASRLMHGLKGAAVTLGIDSLSLLAADAERGFAAEPTLTAPDDEAIAALASAVTRTLADFRLLDGALRAGLTPPVPSTASSSPVDEAQRRQALDALALLLQRSDFRALDAFDALRQAQGGERGEWLDPLGAAIASMDFATAIERCDALRRGGEMAAVG